MTAKENKYLNIVCDLSVSMGKGDYEGVNDCFEKAIALDYSSAVTLWEFTLSKWNCKLTSPESALNIVDGIESVFESVGGARFARTVVESTAIRTAIYRYSPTAFGREKTVGYLVALTSAGKADDADEILKVAFHNAQSEKSFGAFLLDVTDATIKERLAKGVTPVVPKKVETLILDYANKIKGAEKAVILQKLKEIK